MPATKKKLSPPKTAICPKHKVEATWSIHTARYVCDAAGRYRTHSFTGNVGVCEECSSLGSPEPATRDSFNYDSRLIVQVPNIDRSSDSSLEGLFYCGIHSPSKKTARRVKKTMIDVAARDARLSAREAAKIARDARVAHLREVIAPATPEAQDALDELVKLLQEERRLPLW